MNRTFSIQLLVFLLATPVLLFADMRVTNSKGYVVIIPKGAVEASPAPKGWRLRQGDSFITQGDSSVEFATKEGTVIELTEGATFKIRSIKKKVQSFVLKSGKMFARIFKSKEQKFNVRTPVAVASVRGTDFILKIDSKGVLHAGVINGVVHFTPLPNASPKIVKLWPSAGIFVKKKEGLIVKPNAAPLKIPNIPEKLFDSLSWFDRLADRFPEISNEWKNMKPPETIDLDTKFKDKKK